MPHSKNKNLFIFIIIVISISFQSISQKENFTTLFEKSKGTETPDYFEIISFYTKLANQYPEIKLLEIGTTDSGFPLHLILLDADQNFNITNIRKSKRILLINNGIHPGESDGIDATMLLFRDLVQGKIDIPEDILLATIPIYNVGGAINRNSTTRTNQNGPVSYGFRGNARNYDLNRDFIKQDTKNANAFAIAFHLLKPDVFIDNHVSNGADYQYVLTHLLTQHNKLGGVLGNYLHENFRPLLENKLAEKNWDITPYVNVWGGTPEEGWEQFLDTPRYSTGYTTLWNTLGMMVESHMLKPYKVRVEGTYELLKSVIEIMEIDEKKIKSVREQALEEQLLRKTYQTNWVVDTTQFSNLLFKGYEGRYIESPLTGGKRLYYNPEKPYTKKIKYREYFKPQLTVDVPEAYVIPQGWWNVISRLKSNNIEMYQLTKDSVTEVEVYHIADYQTRETPYEGHYLHENTTIEKSKASLSFRKGDYIIKTRQPGLRYLMETLEPEAVDSFFNWNFFDTILQQKEGFSAYVWEDKAIELVKNSPDLRNLFEAKKVNDADFADSEYEQLDWLHKQSDSYEKSHLRYPIYRILK